MVTSPVRVLLRMAFSFSVLACRGKFMEVNNKRWQQEKLRGRTEIGKQMWMIGENFQAASEQCYTAVTFQDLL